MFLIVDGLTGGDSQDVIGKSGGDGVHTLALGKDAGVEIDPAGFAIGQRGIGRYLHGGNEAAEGGAAARGEEDNLAAGGGKGRGGHEVVSGGR